MRVREVIVPTQAFLARFFPVISFQLYPEGSPVRPETRRPTGPAGFFLPSCERLLVCLRQWARPPGMADLADPELLTGPSDNGEVAARPFTEDHSMSDNPAKHGKYPRRATREAGLNDIMFTGFAADGALSRHCRGGQGSRLWFHLRIDSRSGHFLAQNVDHKTVPDGVLTSAPTWALLWCGD